MDWELDMIRLGVIYVYMSIFDNIYIIIQQQQQQKTRYDMKGREKYEIYRYITYWEQ